MPEIKSSVFIEELRGQHPHQVFHYNEKPVKSMLNSAWRKARKRVGLPQVRVHDLKHTFGRRLEITPTIGCEENRKKVAT